MDPKRKRIATLKTCDPARFWELVRAYRQFCRNCGALAGHPCRNYRGQRKAICEERGTPEPLKVATARPKELSQGLLFPADDATSRGK